MNPRLFGKVWGKGRKTQPIAPGFRDKICFWIYLLLSLLTTVMVIFRGPVRVWAWGKVPRRPWFTFGLGHLDMPTISQSCLHLSTGTA